MVKTTAGDRNEDTQTSCRLLDNLNYVIGALSSEEAPVRSLLIINNFFSFIVAKI